MAGGLLAVLLSAATALSQPAASLDYQGKLTDASGLAIPDGTVSLTFGLWSQEVGGLLHWSETHPAVEVRDGLFSVRLGSLTPIADYHFRDARFLEITVGTEPPLARQPWTAAPYALSTFLVDADGVDSAALVDGAVTLAHLAADAVDGSRIVDASLGLDDLDSGMQVFTCSGITSVGGGWTEVCNVTVPPGFDDRGLAYVGTNLSYEFDCVGTGEESRLEVALFTIGTFPSDQRASGWLGTHSVPGPPLPDSLSLTGISPLASGDIIRVRVRKESTSGCGAPVADRLSVRAWFAFAGS